MYAIRSYYGLWLGGVISARRDKALIQALVDKVRAIALCRPLLVAVDGLPSYVKAFQRAFRSTSKTSSYPSRELIDSTMGAFGSRTAVPGSYNFV